MDQFSTILFMAIWLQYLSLGIIICLFNFTNLAGFNLLVDKDADGGEALGLPEVPVGHPALLGHLHGVTLLLKLDKQNYEKRFKLFRCFCLQKILFFPESFYIHLFVMKEQFLHFSVAKIFGRTKNNLFSKVAIPLTNFSDTKQIKVSLNLPTSTTTFK